MCCHLPKLPPAWRSHPIFFLRRCLIFNAVIGFIMCLMCIMSGVEPYGLPVWTISLIMLGVSGMFSVLDLSLWALEEDDGTEQAKRCKDCKKRFKASGASATAANDIENAAHLTQRRSRGDGGSDDDNGKKPHWPKKTIMILDFVFGLVFIWCWFSTLSTTMFGYNFTCGVSPVGVFQSYATLTAIIGSVVHFKCWWAELMARKQTKWIRVLEDRGKKVRALRLSPDEIDCLLPADEAPDHPHAQRGHRHSPQHQEGHPSEGICNEPQFPWQAASVSKRLNDRGNKKTFSEVQRVVHEENQRVISALTPTTTGSSEALVSMAEESSSSEEEQHTKNRSGYGSIASSHMMSGALPSSRRYVDRSALQHTPDAVDEECDEAIGTPGAAGADDDAAIVVKKIKKAKKSKTKGSKI